MSRPPKHDPEFEIRFYEGVHRRCRDYTEVIELLGGLYTKAGRIRRTSIVTKNQRELQSVRSIAGVSGGRHGVIAATVERMTTHDSPDCQQHAHDQPALRQCLKRVSAARRRKSTVVSDDRRQRQLIRSNHARGDENRYGAGTGAPQRSPKTLEPARVAVPVATYSRAGRRFSHTAWHSAASLPTADRQTSNVQPSPLLVANRIS